MSKFIHHTDKGDVIEEIDETKHGFHITNDPDKTEETLTFRQETDLLIKLCEAEREKANKKD